MSGMILTGFPKKRETPTKIQSQNQTPLIQTPWKGTEIELRLTISSRVTSKWWLIYNMDIWVQSQDGSDLFDFSKFGRRPVLCIIELMTACSSHCEAPYPGQLSERKAKVGYLGRGWLKADKSPGRLKEEPPCLISLRPKMDPNKLFEVFCLFVSGTTMLLLWTWSKCLRRPCAARKQVSVSDSSLSAHV